MAVRPTSTSLSKGNLEAYVCPAEEAVEIKLVSKESDIKDNSLIFHPEFCHQIFGDGENIFGYKNLKVRLYYTAARLTTYLGMKYTDKISPSKSEGVKPDDVMQIVGEQLQPGFLTNLNTFTSALSKESSFKPFGEKLHSFTANDQEVSSKDCYEVYKCDITTEGFVNYHERMQTFVLWFIDAASYIDSDDDRWEYFVLFRKYTLDDKTMYAFVGYTTVYQYYAYPSKTRPRISQMIILPPYQKNGLGAELLEVVYRWYIKESDVLDITVEDASEAFTRIRDFVDVKNCMKLASFHKDKLKLGFCEAMHQEAQNKLKVNKKQARKIYEILRLKATDLKNKQAYREYRLDVKKRLNAPFQKQIGDMKKLKSILSDEEYEAAVQCNSRDQRIEQLESRYRELEDEYRNIIEKLAARM